jgi:hypothetical protein
MIHELFPFVTELAAKAFGPISRFLVGTNKEQEHECLSASCCSGRAQKANDGALVLARYV